MLRAAKSLLPHSILCAPLVPARPLPRALLAAFAPPLQLRPSLLHSPARAVRSVFSSASLCRALLSFPPTAPPPLPLPAPSLQLHVFAKLAGENDDFAQVFVTDGSVVGGLKKAIITELKLNAAPNCMRLLLVVEGGLPVPLDSRKALALQGVMAGASVVVELLPPPPPPSPRLPYVLVRQGGTHLGFTKVTFAPSADAEDLKEAVCSKLMLGAAPNRLRLLLEVEGGALLPLDSCQALAGQGVMEGATVVVELLPLPLHALSGFISHAPDAALDTGLLAALTATDTPDAQRVEALSLLVADHCTRFPARPADDPSLALPLFHTSAHATLLRVLVTHARTLAAGRYNGTNGAHCRTLVGARGIGKSALMRAFALVAPSAFPSLLPVYLTGQGILQPQHVLQAGHLQSALAAAAAQQNVPFIAHSNLPTGRRLLLMVDEFDDLYRVPASAPALVQNVLATLGILGYLGDRTDGNCSILLCGSSSSTYDLVQGKGARLGRNFPLAAGGIPDLNCTKFDRLRLPAPLCNATAEVEAMVVAMAGSSGWVPGHPRPTAAARLLTFYLGSSPRAVTRIIVPQSLQELTGSLLASASPAIPPDDAFEHPSTGAFLRALLARLAEGNNELRALTRKYDGSANFLAIMDPACPWEQAVTPLTWQQVEAAFHEVVGSASAPAHPAVLMSMLDEITDKHVLRLHYPSIQETAAQVWPATAAQAVAGGFPGDADLAGAAGAIGKAAKDLVLLYGAVKPLL